jgi:hypothetical protein
MLVKDFKNIKPFFALKLYSCIRIKELLFLLLLLLICYFFRLVGLTIDDLNLSETFSHENKIEGRKLNFMSLNNMNETQSKVNKTVML